MKSILGKHWNFGKNSRRKKINKRARRHKLGCWFQKIAFLTSCNGSLNCWACCPRLVTPQEAQANTHPPHITLPKRKQIIESRRLELLTSLANLHDFSSLNALFLVNPGKVKEWSIYSYLNAQFSLFKSDWTAISDVD